MTAVLSKSFETRTACLNVPAKAPDPLYSFGDRLIVIAPGETIEDLLVHVGIVKAISIKGGEWSYYLDFKTDELCAELTNYSSVEDADCWFSEMAVQPLSKELAHKARVLLAQEMVALISQGILGPKERLNAFVARGYIDVSVAA